MGRDSHGWISGYCSYVSWGISIAIITKELIKNEENMTGHVVFIIKIINYLFEKLRFAVEIQRVSVLSRPII